MPENEIHQTQETTRPFNPNPYSPYGSQFPQQNQTDPNLQNTTAIPNTHLTYPMPPFSSPSAVPFDVNVPGYPYQSAPSSQPAPPPGKGGGTTTVSLRTPLQQYKDYVKLLLIHNAKRARRMRLMHNIFQVTILVGAALVSIIIGIHTVSPTIAAVISGVVTIATALANYYKFGEKSRDLFKSTEDIQQEYNWFKSQRGPYRKISEEQALIALQDRIDAIKREQFLRSFALEEQKDERK